ncbi:MAG: hypothetical protein QOD33_564, partial [Pyrinomonadaceae bacterium]|nr:hypothetical protein [Pyrinomonadaceae bacterium]
MIAFFLELLGMISLLKLGWRIISLEVLPAAFRLKAGAITKISFLKPNPDILRPFRSQP